MRKPESVRENEMHNIFWDFEIKTDYITQARRLELIIVNKREIERENLLTAVPVGQKGI